MCVCVCDNCDQVMCDNVICERIVCDKVVRERVVCERDGCERVVCVCVPILYVKEFCVIMGDKKREEPKETDRRAQQKTEIPTQRCGEQIQP